MSILISGDFHANEDHELFSVTKNTLIRKYGQRKYDEIKYQIILGDAGFLWPGYEKIGIQNYAALSKRPFPVLSVVGNHDPVLGRPDLPEADIGIGEKVIMIKEEKPLVAYLKRGKVYNIENHKILALGGALSIDKAYQQLNNTWWKNEYWSEAEKKTLFKLLDKDNHFDYVLAHTGPIRVNEMLNPFSRIGFPLKFYDEVAALNEKIDGRIICKQWFCGHWHNEKYHYDQNYKRGYQYLYRKTALLSGDEVKVL